MKRSCSSVPQRASRAGGRARCQKRGDQRAQQQLLRQATCARAAASRSRAARAGRGARSGRRASTACRCRTRRGGCCRWRRSAGCGTGDRPARADLRLAWLCSSRESDLQLVDRIVARLVDARVLAGRADEHAREEVRERRVVVPVGDQAARAGRAGAGTASPPAVGPPSTKWLPPPVPVWRPSSMNFSVREPRLARLRRRGSVVLSTSSAQLFTGWTLTSSTPGSGVMRSASRRGSRGGS